MGRRGLEAERGRILGPRRDPVNRILPPWAGGFEAQAHPFAAKAQVSASSGRLSTVPSLLWGSLASAQAWMVGITADLRLPSSRHQASLYFSYFALLPFTCGKTDIVFGVWIARIGTMYHVSSGSTYATMDPAVREADSTH